MGIYMSYCLNYIYKAKDFSLIYGNCKVASYWFIKAQNDFEDVYPTEIPTTSCDSDTREFLPCRFSDRPD